MDDRIRWINHKGQKILRVDYSGLDAPAMVSLIRRVPSYYEGLERRKHVGCLVDVRRAAADTAVLEEMKKVVLTTTIHYDRKGAVLGADGAKGVLLWAVNFFTGHNVRPFDDESEALDWLAT